MKQNVWKRLKIIMVVYIIQSNKQVKLKKFSLWLNLNFRLKKYRKKQSKKQKYKKN